MRPGNSAATGARWKYTVLTGTATSFFDQCSQMQVLQQIVRFARKPPGEQWSSLRSRLGETDWYWKVHSPGNDRTLYVTAPFGSGRNYIIELVLEHFGERAKYFRQGMRFRGLRTSMLYSGHASIKHVSRYHELPEVTSRVVEAARSRLADLIFIYRHPLDALLTNWVWWRKFIRDEIMITGTSNVYKNTDELCANLEQNFSDFKAFADGDPAFFAAAPGPRFLSFSEFVEETELYLQSATVALRLEDFVIDPLKEFSKIVEVLSDDLDLSRIQVAPPRTKPYGFLAVQNKVPQFRNFINELDAETKRRIEKIGYKLGA
jgi:hypothetical protein